MRDIAQRVECASALIVTPPFLKYAADPRSVSRSSRPPPRQR